MTVPTFNADATGFDDANMVYLAACAKLSYKKNGSGTDGVAINDLLSAWGLNGPASNNGSAFFKNDKTDTEGFIAGDDDKIIIAFRGTEGSSLTDWRTDSKIHKVKFRPKRRDMDVHRGFLQAFNSVKQHVEDGIADLGGNGQKIWITGHSLGAAVAVICAGHLQFQMDTPITPQGVYTFGQPRTGDHDFAKGFNRRLKGRTCRFVNNNDVVTRVPPQIFGYSHVGQLGYFDHNGAFKTGGSMTWWSRFWDRVAGRLDDLWDADLDGIGDHSMDNYLTYSAQYAGVQVPTLP